METEKECDVLIMLFYGLGHTEESLVIIFQIILKTFITPIW